MTQNREVLDFHCQVDIIQRDAKINIINIISFKVLTNVASDREGLDWVAGLQSIQSTTKKRIIAIFTTVEVL